ncbi:hypothetical protein PSECIP111951_02558 [Pseudoalteromonas holothuriae]|uniref:Uncharacterized protein n=1 Tax=Pseudoalteromonas holothuriae TaxID=2963714 RepID=A0A9W4R0S6_9GAMM|nr:MULTISPECIES: hypothetical protein [unclassified Pseudoalteromonas]CAH9061774.1 hypothetical protein PSECIP111951_02558 [Pseudoalteromonas sp. CIP111951]CAH9062066.1 hypothetical protein PSECIP111854_02938 [Pseudoalteromonas sp. CIP111854]
MSESKVKEGGSNFAGLMSAAFASGFATSSLDGFEVNYSFFIGSLDVVSISISFIVFSILFYPFNKFFGWLYCASPNNK